MSNLRAVKGMNDIFYPEILLWQKIEKLTAEIFSAYGFQEIRTPILESLNLFVRGVGEATDIVEKEMYVFPDRDETNLALRPEGTAGVVRALIQNQGLNADSEIKYYYIGPMFRRERPQKGRLRQFHQIGAEFFGIKEASCDVEVIAMIYDLLTSLGIENLSLAINSLGNADERARFVNELYKFLSDAKLTLCSDCQRRLEKNTLRILDCKNPSCVALVEKAPSIVNFLDPDTANHFNQVKEGLVNLKIPFVVQPKLVRGLDYYTKTVFEISAITGLGSQNAVAAGGRFDGLVKNLGGPEIPAFGFSAGIERIILLLKNNAVSDSSELDIMLVTADEAGRDKAYALLYELRSLRIKTDIDHRNRSIKAQMRRANRLNSKAILVLGSKEVSENKAEIKWLSTGETVLVDLRGQSIKDEIQK